MGPVVPPPSHWDPEDDTRRAPNGFELQLYVHASQLLCHSRRLMGSNPWEPLLDIFLRGFGFGAGERSMLTHQVGIVIGGGVGRLHEYIHNGWHQEYSDTNMRILCAILEVKVILAVRRGV